MKLLLCSDFKNVGYTFLDRFFDLSQKHTCLFIGYASEDYDGDSAYTSSSMDKICSLGFDIVCLEPDYDFSDKIDMIFVRGGNTTKLIHLLRKFNQFEKIKKLVLGGALYVGESAGSVLAGSDTEWTLRSEPYDFDVKAAYGKKALLGYGFVDKLVFVHCSKFRFPYSDELSDGRIVRLPNTEFYSSYLKDIRLYPKTAYITLGNNQVYFRDGKISKILTFDWSKIPVER